MSTITKSQGWLACLVAQGYIGAGYIMGKGRGFGKNPKIKKAGSYSNNKNNWGEFEGGLDCSGLIYQTFKFFDVKIREGTAGMQCHDAEGLQQQISLTWDLKKMQPGDIIYFCGTFDSEEFKVYYERNIIKAIKQHGSIEKVPFDIKKNNISHAALYWGNGLILHASGKANKTLVQKISPYLLSRFVVVKRIKSSVFKNKDLLLPRN
jgi:cell wall-associated NlpC family hydrolase